MEIKEKESLKDYELIEEYKKGNNEALDILLTRYKNYIFNISYRFMRYGFNSRCFNSRL